MTKPRLWIVASLLLCLVSCASPQKQLSREEWLQVRNRYYENTTPEAVFRAVERLFKLADARDMQFSYNEDAMKAIRWAAPFPIHIWYHWDIKASPKASGTSVNVSIYTTAHGFGVPAGMTPHDFSDVIALFYSRLDYLLGKSKTWYSCDAFSAKVPDHSTLEALCMLADDLSPSEP